LITLTAAHRPDQLARAQHDAPIVDGFAPILYVGATDAGVPYENALVELLPPGEPPDVRAPLTEQTLAHVGSSIAGVVAAAHAQGKGANGIRPELVYVSTDTEPVFSGLCVGGPDFIATAPQPMHGPRSYRVPYFSYEAGVVGLPVLASDVFALCATLFFLGTGRHPFGDPNSLRAMLLRLAQGAPEAWPGDVRLGAILARGLDRDPNVRPSAEQIARDLAAFVRDP
jgi:serine/threonine-protein kinase